MDAAATPDGQDPGLPASSSHAAGAAGDPLAAFLDGLHRLTTDGGMDMPATVAAGPPSAMLSNGFNADAGVAQLVSALASLHDGNAAFNATPFAATDAAGLDGAIAPASQ